jgi:ATP synthase protein I
MSPPARWGWVLKLAAGQLVVALPVVVAFALYAGTREAGAALGGALIAASGQALFGFRLFAPGVAPAARLVRAFYAAAILKWVWVVGLTGLALAVLKLAPLPLVAGLAAGMVGFLLAGAWLG